MAVEPNPYADIAPALGDLTSWVLFGEVWGFTIFRKITPSSLQPTFGD